MPLRPFRAIAHWLWRKRDSVLLLIVLTLLVVQIRNIVVRSTEEEEAQPQRHPASIRNVGPPPDFDFPTDRQRQVRKTTFDPQRDFAAAPGRMSAAVKERLGIAGPEPETKVPDVRAFLVYPVRPAIVLTNVSKQETARNAVAKVRFWNLSRPHGDTLVRAAASVTSCTAMGPRESCGPVSLQLQNRPAAGDELFGFVLVQCPACPSSHVYWANIIVGQKGAFTEGKLTDYDWDHMNPLNARQVVNSFRGRRDLWRMDEYP